MFPVFQATNGGSETACHSLGVTQQVNAVGRVQVCWAGGPCPGRQPHPSRRSCLSGPDPVLSLGPTLGHYGLGPPLAWQPASSHALPGWCEQVIRRARGPLEVGERDGARHRGVTLPAAAQGDP